MYMLNQNSNLSLLRHGQLLKLNDGRQIGLETPLKMTFTSIDSLSRNITSKIQLAYKEIWTFLVSPYK